MEAPHGDYAFSKHLNAWLRELGRPAPRGLAKWSLVFLANYAAIWVVIVTLAVTTMGSLCPSASISPSAPHQADQRMTLSILGWRSALSPNVNRLAAAGRPQLGSRSSSGRTFHY